MTTEEVCPSWSACLRNVERLVDKGDGQLATLSLDLYGATFEDQLDTLQAARLQVVRAKLAVLPMEFVEDGELPAARHAFDGVWPDDRRQAASQNHGQYTRLPARPADSGKVPAEPRRSRRAGGVSLSLLQA